MKVVFCDNIKNLMNENLIKAYDQVFNLNGKQKDLLYYFTVNDTQEKEIYKVTSNVWEKQNIGIKEVLNESYILLDTLWSDTGADETRNDIVNWCKDNKGHYKKVLVYSVFGRDDAEKFVLKLKEKNIDTFDSAVTLIDAKSYEQFSHFKQCLKRVQTDFEERGE